MLTPESRVKKVITTKLKAEGIYYFFPITAGYGAASGVPDIIGCYKGMFFGIECKAGRGTCTDLQKRAQRQIAEAGGATCVLNEKNMADVVTWLKEQYQLYALGALTLGESNE